MRSLALTPSRPSRARHAKLFSIAALLAVLVASARSARAQTMESAAGAALGIVCATPAAAVGLVADTGAAIHLASGRHRVPKAWSVTGVVSWTVASLCMLPVAGVALDRGNFSSSSQSGLGFFAATAVASGVSLGSLAFSVYALTRAPDAPPDRGYTPPRASFALDAPRIAPAPGGARVVLGGSF